jgi:hypothetical protein
MEETWSSAVVNVFIIIDFRRFDKNSIGSFLIFVGLHWFSSKKSVMQADLA